MKKSDEIIIENLSLHILEDPQILHKENQTLRAILNSLAEGVAVADKDGKIIFSNPVAKKIVGLGPQDVALTEWATVYGCYYADKVTPYISEQLPLVRAMRGEEITDEIIFIKNPQRPIGVYISVFASPLRNTCGTISGGAIVFRDITDQKVAEEKLDRFVRAVEQTADSIIITDKEGVIEYVNPAFEATTGFSREEAVGQTPSILKSGQHDRTFYNKLWSTIKSGQHYRGTIINMKKNGELYWSEQTITPMKDEDGNITNFVSVLMDITEMKKRQEYEFQLRIAQKVQQCFFKETICLPGFDIAGASYSAVETSGDYFDFISMPDGYLWIAVGDVTGHGIGAALIMSETRAYLRAFAKLDTDPAAILTQLNKELAADLDREHFVTLILAKLDPEERSLVYSSAGHVSAFLLSSYGEVRYVLESTDIPLGIMHDNKFNKSELIKLAPEDIAIFLTDGIIEAEAPDETEFGSNRALDIINCHRQETACEIVERLYLAVRSFSENHTQEDDVTSVVCKVDPTS